MPPFKIRMKNDINSKLGKKAIIDGYVQIPVYSYLESTYEDDINFHNCPYMDAAKNYYFA